MSFCLIPHLLFIVFWIISSKYLHGYLSSLKFRNIPDNALPTSNESQSLIDRLQIPSTVTVHSNSCGIMTDGHLSTEEPFGRGASAVSTDQLSLRYLT